jgi:hypothetical protein
MDIICSTDRYSPSDRAVFNSVRKLKGLHSLADVTLVDGKTVDPFMFNREPSDSSRVFCSSRVTMTFCVTSPSTTMSLDLWCHALND